MNNAQEIIKIVYFKNKIKKEPLAEYGFVLVLNVNETKMKELSKKIFSNYNNI